MATTEPPAERPTCPTCGVALHPRGKRTRRLRTAGGEITIARTYGICPVCGTGLFPPR